MPAPRIVVMTTGGTIASERDVSGRSLSGALAGADLLSRASLPEHLASCVEVHSVLQKPSNAITLDDLSMLRQHCLELIQEGNVSAIVITHGTDTLEDTAWFLDLTLPRKLPVVVTGSQRPPHQAGTDAFCNIADAIRVAAIPATRGLGVLVVFNQTLLAARHARKVSSYQLHGFASPTTGPLGYVDGDDVCLLNQPGSAPVLPLQPVQAMPRVDIVTAYLDASPDLIQASISGGACGIIIEGLGRGHVPPTWLDIISQARALQVVIVVVSSCLAGPVHQSYEFAGSLASLEQAGAIPVRDLNARKARIALSVLLAESDTSNLAIKLKALSEPSRFNDNVIQTRCTSSA
ncbi:asparaginase [Halomonas cupida]|uniref:asparaginase n=1 Tax=Halomonas cupida TaxID=44933 RepID=UPI0039B4B749